MISKYDLYFLHLALQKYSADSGRDDSKLTLAAAAVGHLDEDHAGQKARGGDREEQMEREQRVPSAVALSLLALGPARPLPSTNQKHETVEASSYLKGPYTLLEVRPLTGISKEGKSSSSSLLGDAVSHTDAEFALMSRANQVLLDFQAAATGTRGMSMRDGPSATSKSLSSAVAVQSGGIDGGEVLRGRMIDIRDSILGNEGALMHRCVEARRLVNGRPRK